MSNENTVRILAEVLERVIKERDEAREDMRQLLPQNIHLRMKLPSDPSGAPDMTPSPAVTGRPFYPKTDGGK